MTTDQTPEPYTPTLAVLRARHSTYVTEAGGVVEREAARNAEWDRALAAHDREVAAKAKSDAARDIANVGHWTCNDAECPAHGCAPNPYTEESQND